MYISNPEDKYIPEFEKNTKGIKMYMLKGYRGEKSVFSDECVRSEVVIARRSLRMLIIL